MNNTHDGTPLYYSILNNYVIKDVKLAELCLAIDLLRISYICREKTFEYMDIMNVRHRHTVKDIQEHYLPTINKIMFLDPRRFLLAMQMVYLYTQIEVN